VRSFGAKIGERHSDDLSGRVVFRRVLKKQTVPFVLCLNAAALSYRRPVSYGGAVV
jgi:hypothetical protein